MEEFLREYASASKVCMPPEQRKCLKAVEVVKSFMKATGVNFVRDSKGKPLLMTYGNDGTPIKICHRVPIDLPTGRIWRKGAAGADFLVEKGFLKRFGGDGGHVVRGLLRDCRDCTTGKTAWHTFGAMREFFPFLRELGHDCIAIQHTCFDRAQWSALTRRTRAFLNQIDADDPICKTEIHAILKLTHWYVSSGCGTHDCQNGLKKGCIEPLDDPIATSRNVFIAVEGLTNSFDLLHRHMYRFIQEVVVFDDRQYDRMVVARFWHALAIPEDIMETMVDFNPVWDPVSGKLSIAGKHREEGFVPLAELIFSMMKFKRFTESRWSTAGVSSRQMIAGHICGLEGLVTRVRADPKCSDFYIHGYTRYGLVERRLSVVLALSSYVADAVIALLLEDDRLCRQYQEVHSALNDEIAWLEDLPLFVWKRLSVFCVVPPHELRDDVLRAAYVQRSFIDWRVLSELRGYPWCLTDGDVDENLTMLHVADKPLDPTARKIQALVKLGYPRATLVKGVMLLREVHWTTVVVEQGHGSVATVHKLHREFGPDMVVARSFLHMLKPLIFASPDDRNRAAFLARIAKLERKVPQRLNGRSLFLADLFNEARQLLVPGVPFPRDTQQRLFETHSDLYDGLSVEQRSCYEQRAVRESDGKAKELEELICDLYQKEELRRLRSDSTRADRGVMCRMESCRFSQSDFEKLDKLFGSGMFDQDAVADKRRVALMPPQPPPIAEQLMIENLAKEIAVVPRNTPQWSKIVCRHRKWFRDCALRIVDSPDNIIYLFVYAVQQPLLSMYMPLVPSGRPRRYPSLLDNREHDEANFPHEYTVFSDQTVYDTEIEGDIHNLEVLPFVGRFGGKRFVSEADFVRFQDFSPSLDDVADDTSDDEEMKHAALTERDKVIIQYPWMEDFLFDIKEKVEPKPLPKRRYIRASEMMDDGEGNVPSADICAEAYDVLMRKKLEWEDSHEADDFVANVRGGKWTIERKGVPFDFVRGYARTDDAMAWADRYLGKKSSNYSVRLYGEEICNVLALEWARRCQGFFEYYKAAGDPLFRYGPEHVPPAYTGRFQIILDTVAPGSKVYIRAQQIVGTWPRNP